MDDYYILTFKNIDEKSYVGNYNPDINNDDSLYFSTRLPL